MDSHAVVITGARAGVGRATAQTFARRGARMGLIARGAERLQVAEDDLNRLGDAGLSLTALVAPAMGLWQVGRIVFRKA